MPIVDDMARQMQIQIYALWYNILLSLAGIQWSAERAVTMMGYTIELMNTWLVNNAFTPLIAQTNASLQVAVTAAFAIAMLVLGITYLLASFARIRVVDPRSAIAWYLAGALFFALGPQLYQGMSDFRRDVSQAFYASALSGLQGATGASFNSLDSVDTAELGLLPLCDDLGSYMPTWNATIDGLDVALAYLRADGIDVMGYPSTPSDPSCQPHPPDPVTGKWTAGQIPWEWRRPGSFFDNTGDPVFFSSMTDQQRADSINRASSAQGRLLTAWPLILFGVAEQLVYFLLTVAQGLTFLSFGVAILFAFFKKTEVIARSIIDLWIALIVQTVVIALIQSLVVTFFLAGTASNNGVVVLGVGLICLIFMLIVLWSGVKAVWNSVNRLFNAFGQVTGGVMVSPGAAAAVGALGAVGAGAALLSTASSFVAGTVSVGSSALAGLTALQQGATPAQAAGLVMGDSQPLVGAARTLAYLPGVRGTELGEAAEQFTEGALTRRVAGSVPLVGRVTGPLVGSMLLTDRDPEAADYDKNGRVVSRPMLVPAVAQSLSNWTTPRRGRTSDLDGNENDSSLANFAPAHPRRMGMFTPLGSVSAEPSQSTTAERDQQADANDRRDEEMEPPLSTMIQAAEDDQASQNGADRIESAAERLVQSAEALEQAADSMRVFGELRINGPENVAGVMGDALRNLSTQHTAHGLPASGADNFAVAGAMSQALGVTPPAGGSPPVQENLARFGLFLDQAVRMGVSPEQAERTIREVKASPDRRLTSETREELTSMSASVRSQPRAEAERDVARLETAARGLPDQIVASGTMVIPPPAVPVNQAIHREGISGHEAATAP
ncbi:MAG: hypothetical protein ABI700_00275 [Chloroflexota bacterium]